MTLLCPLISPTLLPVSKVMQWPKLSCQRRWRGGEGGTNRSFPSPTAMIRLLSPSQARSLIGPEMMWNSPFVTMSSPTQSHTRTLPEASPEAT
jgi:hypothetical protein